MLKSRVAAAALVVATTTAGLGLAGGVAEASPVMASGTVGYLAGDSHCCKKNDRDDDDRDRRKHRDPRRDQALVPGVLSGVNGLLNGVGHAVNSLLRGVV